MDWNHDYELLPTPTLLGRSVAAVNHCGLDRHWNSIEPLKSKLSRLSFFIK